MIWYGAVKDENIRVRIRKRKARSSSGSFWTKIENSSRSWIILFIFTSSRRDSTNEDGTKMQTLVFQPNKQASGRIGRRANDATAGNQVSNVDRSCFFSTLHGGILFCPKWGFYSYALWDAQVSHSQSWIMANAWPAEMCALISTTALLPSPRSVCTVARKSAWLQLTICQNSATTNLRKTSGCAATKRV